MVDGWPDRLRAGRERYVTGQSQGELLAHLLNQEVDKRNRQAYQRQQDLRNLFAALPVLTERLPAIRVGAPWPSDVKRLLEQVNSFLQTCAQYPQLLPGHEPGTPLRLLQVFAPVNPIRSSAGSAICDLHRFGLLDRVRRCLRCEKWFFAKKLDSKYCSRNCQTQPTEQYRATKREYAKRRYWEEKQRAEQAKIRVRGGRK